MKSKCIYRSYCLASITTPSDDGRYRARVVIIALGDERTRSQRFLDLETFSSVAEAEDRAIAGGKEWVDKQLMQDQFQVPTDFAALPLWGHPQV